MNGFCLATIWSICVLAAATARGAPDDLPDIGSPADAILTQSQEAQIGRMIMHQLRATGQIIIDPELVDYIEEVGHRLVIHAHDGQHRFTFFLVDDNRINAFALPGGYIGVNSGLVLQTKTESELASVLAHEVAHVTQRHIARRLQDTQRTSLAQTAGVLAAILLGAVTGVPADAIMAGVSVAQSAAAQHMINFTRANEYDADRIGMGVLVAADFDPHAMPAFFETLGRQSGAASQIPEYLQTHPLSSSRIAETRNRALQYPRVAVPSSQTYLLAREKLRVISMDPEEALTYYRDLSEAKSGDLLFEEQYGLALALQENGEAREAERIFASLLSHRDDVIAYHTGLGKAQLAAGDVNEAVETLAHAVELFPRNVPVTLEYSEALVQAGQAKKAHEVLLDLLNNVPPTPEQARLIARVASTAGDTAEAHYYMSEYHLLVGELPLAMNQLQLALAVPDLDSVQRARFEARLKEIAQYVPEQPKQRQTRDGDDGGSEGP